MNAKDFTPHGFYTVSNAGGFEIELSNCGDYARMRDAFGSDDPEVSDWYKIDYIIDENDTDEVIAVIDPEGYNIPLNEVMRIM